MHAQSTQASTSISPPLASGDARHWPEIARRWNAVASPLRPCAEDTAIYEKLVRSWSDKNGPPRALILGVTPELYHLDWPVGSSISAIDHTLQMIESVWPGPREAVLHADWREIPLPNGSRDIVVCDGGLHLLPHPDGHAALLHALHRVLAPNGLCIFRLYAPPDQAEAPSQVLADLLAGKISDLNILKLRLGMALQKNATLGIRLGDVWNTLRETAPDFDLLASQIGRPVDHLSAIETYRDCDNRYHFLRSDEVRTLFCKVPGGFTFESVHSPGYALGERCPILAFRRTDAAI